MGQHIQLDNTQQHRWYIKATGSTCYDRTGLTFPYGKSFPWKKSIRTCCRNPRISWAKQFGWVNQPQVICFAATSAEAAQLSDFLTERIPGSVIVHTHWDQFDKYLPPVKNKTST